MGKNEEIYKISDELLSSILGEEILQNRGCCDKHKEYSYFYVSEIFVKDIEVFKLCDWAKRWALEENNGTHYNIETKFMTKVVDKKVVTVVFCWVYEGMDIVALHEEYDEYKAVFKACQWIYEKIKDI